MLSPYLYFPSRELLFKRMHVPPLPRSNYSLVWGGAQWPLLTNEAKHRCFNLPPTETVFEYSLLKPLTSLSLVTLCILLLWLLGEQSIWKYLLNKWTTRNAVRNTVLGFIEWILITECVKAEWSFGWPSLFLAATTSNVPCDYFQVSRFLTIFFRQVIVGNAAEAVSFPRRVWAVLLSTWATAAIVL